MREAVFYWFQLEMDYMAAYSLDQIAEQQTPPAQGRERPGMLTPAKLRPGGPGKEPAIGHNGHNGYNGHNGHNGSDAEKSSSALADHRFRKSTPAKAMTSVGAPGGSLRLERKSGRPSSLLASSPTIFLCGRRGNETLTLSSQNIESPHATRRCQSLTLSPTELEWGIKW